MDAGSLYQSKLTTPEQAMASIASGSNLSMGMAMAEPPALLKALAERRGRQSRECPALTTNHH
jgi:itaconate CoA-transferase